MTHIINLTAVPNGYRVIVDGKVTLLTTRRFEAYRYIVERDNRFGDEQVRLTFG